jgi:hypothetical protein
LNLLNPPRFLHTLLLHSDEIDEKKGDINNGAPVKVSNPAYEVWFTTDQQVLGFPLTSLSRDILAQVVVARTSAEAWKTITDMFASHISSIFRYNNIWLVGYNSFNRIFKSSSFST